MTNRYYPVALANSLAVQDLSPGQADISITFADDASWYYDYNGSPWSGTYDFTSVALHELGHGLGFIGSTSVDGNYGSIGFNGTPIYLRPIRCKFNRSCRSRLPKRIITR